MPKLAGKICLKYCQFILRRIEVKQGHPWDAFSLRVTGCLCGRVTGCEFLMHISSVFPCQVLDIWFLGISHVEKNLSFVYSTFTFIWPQSKWPLTSRTLQENSNLLILHRKLGPMASSSSPEQHTVLFFMTLFWFYTF